MALKELTLVALSETKLNDLFQTARNEVAFSFANASDIAGARSISIDLTFKQMDGYIVTEMACTHKVPGRKVHAIAAQDENGSIKIDTVSHDARQPDLLDHTGTNVAPITAAKSAQKGT